MDTITILVIALIVSNFVWLLIFSITIWHFISIITGRKVKVPGVSDIVNVAKKQKEKEGSELTSMLNAPLDEVYADMGKRQATAGS